MISKMTGSSSVIKAVIYEQNAGSKKKALKDLRARSFPLVAGSNFNRVELYDQC
jgi:hypothetical protein